MELENCQQITFNFLLFGQPIIIEMTDANQLQDTRMIPGSMQINNISKNHLQLSPVWSPVFTVPTEIPRQQATHMIFAAMQFDLTSPSLDKERKYNLLNFTATKRNQF